MARRNSQPKVGDYYLRVSDYGGNGYKETSIVVVVHIHGGTKEVTTVTLVKQEGETDWKAMLEHLAMDLLTGAVPWDLIRASIEPLKEFLGRRRQQARLCNVTTDTIRIEPSKDQRMVLGRAYADYTARAQLPSPQTMRSIIEGEVQ